MGEGQGEGKGPRRELTQPHAAAERAVPLRASANRLRYRQHARRSVAGEQLSLTLAEPAELLGLIAAERREPADLTQPTESEADPVELVADVGTHTSKLRLRDPRGSRDVVLMPG